MVVYVFGSNGMLGHVVVETLNPHYHVVPVTRDMFDATTDDLGKVLRHVNNNDVVINCIGAIPQKNPSTRDYIQLNTLFPLKIQHLMSRIGFKFIHITTDCVFDGKKGSYVETDEHTANDIYGTTKSLGEPRFACVIRTSIIGEELTGKKSLLEWVRSNKDGQIFGYTNHLWNGVTCKTLANVILKIIQTNEYWTGVRHIHSPNIVSKYDLCKYINEAYDLNIQIIEKEDKQAKNMTLASNYTNAFDIPEIYTQTCAR